MNDNQEGSPSTQSQAMEPEGNQGDAQHQSTSRWRRLALLGGMFTLVAAGSAAVGAILGVSLATPTSDDAVETITEARPALSDLWRRGVRHEVARPINILLMGIDHPTHTEEGGPDAIRIRDGNGNADDSDLRFAGRSDTMLLARLDPQEQAVNLLSIPRDTLVKFPERDGVTKINHANLLGGPKLAAEVIGHNFQDVEVDRYVRFNTAAFRELVDLLDGVEVFVPQDMYYTDETQGLYIDLKAGRQRLNGEQAEQFARFRSDGNGDIGRVQRQQILLGALRDRIASPSILPKIPALISLVRTQIDTNLSGEEILALVDFAMGLNRSDIDMVMLPGRFSQGDRYYASYWIPDAQDVNRVMKDYFQVTGSQRSQTMADRITLTPDAMADSASNQPKQSLRIAVQNASEHPYSAQQMAQHLREQGYEQVYIVPDWPTAQAQTQIIAQRGDVRRATLLERAVGLGTVVSTSTGDLTSDITIRVGQDWSTRLDV
ncbi:MAG: LCP family protein [Elainellaceae cyanobacterium]